MTSGVFPVEEATVTVSGSALCYAGRILSLPNDSVAYEDLVSSV